MISSDKKKFYDFFTDFVTKRGGIHPSESWFDKVESQQQRIRNILGGVKKTVAVELSDNAKAMSPYKIENYYLELHKIIPDYFIYYGIRSIDLSFSIVPVNISGAGTKWAKHANHYLALKGYSKETTEKIMNIFARMGEDWAKSKTEKASLYVTFSTDPRAYALIGRYGCDDNSCFSQIGCNSIHKYRLGQTPNSYVILVTKEVIDQEQENSPNTVARFWGIANNRLDIFNVSNYYPRPGENQGNIQYAVKESFKTLLGSDKIEIANNKISCDQSRLYLNVKEGNLNWSFYKPETLFESQDLTNLIDMSLIPLMVACPRCGGYKDNSKFEAIDGHRYCEECSSKANTCESSGLRTFAKLVEVNDISGKKINIISSVLSNSFFKCAISKEWWHYSTKVITANGLYISKTIAEEKGYVRCASCGSWSNADDMEKKSEKAKSMYCKQCFGIVEDSKTKIKSDHAWIQSTPRSVTRKKLSYSFNDDSN